MVEETDGEVEVTNQIDRVVENTMRENYRLEKKFSKKLDEFKMQTKNKINKVKNNKK